MSTIQEIISYADRKYPNSETNASQVEDLNDIHARVFMKIAKLKHRFEIFEFTSIADQLTYTLPSNCHIDNIIPDGVKLAQDLAVTSNTEFDTFTFAGLNDNVDSGNWYGDPGNGAISLVQDGEPIQTAGYSVRIFYYPRPTLLTSSSLSATPDLDTDYHQLLKYGLIQSLASTGNNPDVEIADYYQKKFDEFFAEIEQNLSDKFNKTPTQSNQIVEWW